MKESNKILLLLKMKIIIFLEVIFHKDGKYKINQIFFMEQENHFYLHLKLIYYLFLINFLRIQIV